MHALEKINLFLEGNSVEQIEALAKRKKKRKEFSKDVLEAFK